MRDRIRELMTDPIDDYDRAVLCVLNELEHMLNEPQGAEVTAAKCGECQQPATSLNSNGMCEKCAEDLQIWLRHGRIGVGRSYQEEVARARRIEAERTSSWARSAEVTEMIERIARKLEPQAWAALGTGDTLAYANRRKSSLRKAQLAIEAMREPGCRKTR
jgi:hypothetical protein